MRSSLFSAIFGLTLVFTTSQGSAETCPDPIKVGWEPWPPFNIPADEGVVGIDPDIFRAVANETGCDVVFNKIPWKRHLRMIKEGEIDVAMAAAKTPERDEYAKWSEHYLPYSAILWVSSDDDQKYQSLHHFLESGKSIGFIRGSTFGEEADNLLEKEKYAKQLQPTKSTSLNIRMIAAGRLDGLIDNSLSTGYAAKQEGLRGDIKKSGVTVDASAIRYMLSEQSVPDELVKKINIAIGELKEDGKIQSIVDKYTN